MSLVVRSTKVQTALSSEDYKALLDACERQGVTVYALVKRAVLELLEREAKAK